MCVPILATTYGGAHNGPEPVYVTYDQGQPEGFAPFPTTAIIPSGLAVPTMVVLTSLGQVRLLGCPAILLIDLVLTVYDLCVPRQWA